MSTIEDCIGLSELTAEEILAICEHARIPEMVALQQSNYLVQNASSEQRIKAMIVDDIEAARRSGDVRHLLALKLCLKHFLEYHAGRTAPS